MHSLRRERNRAGRANKLVDRYLGSMGLWLLGHFRKKNRIPAVPTRIGLFVINAIGDTILVSAIAKDIRQFLPDCEIILITNNTNRGVSSLIDSIDRNVVVPIFKPMETIKILQKERLDVILDFNPWARITAFYAALSLAFVRQANLDTSHLTLLSIIRRHATRLKTIAGCLRPLGYRRRRFRLSRSPLPRG